MSSSAKLAKAMRTIAQNGGDVLIVSIALAPKCAFWGFSPFFKCVFYRSKCVALKERC